MDSLVVHGILQARILEWVAFPFSRGSSQPRDQTQVSCIVGRFFTVWATREAQIVKVKVTQLCSTLCDPMGLYSPCHSRGQNTGVGSLSLLQRISPTQILNLGLPHCRWILYQLRHKGSTRILEWVAYPLSRGSSQPRNWTCVSCIAGGLFTNWAIREVHALITIDFICFLLDFFFSLILQLSSLLSIWWFKNSWDTKMECVSH